MNITTKLFEGHSIRVLPVSQAQDTIWFVASDVSAALGYDAPHRALRHVDADDTASAALQTPGGMQTVTLVSESGVYAMIFGSRRPEAKAFKRWVTSKVLPEIRRTGSYTLKPEDFPLSLDAAGDAEDANLLQSLELAPTVIEESKEEKKRRIAEQFRRLNVTRTGG